MSDIPNPMTWGTIRGSFGALNADSSDAGLVPDLDTVQGTVTLTPRLPLVKIYSVPMIAVAKTIQCRIVDGRLIGPDNSPDVRVVASDSPGIEPSPLQWEVRINIVGAPQQPAPMVINVPTGGVVDLALIVPAVPATPVVTVVSEETKMEAIRAANEAKIAATDAVNARTAANLAKTDAVTARNAAQSAAETAVAAQSVTVQASQDAFSSMTTSQSASNASIKAQVASESAALTSTTSANNARESAGAAEVARNEAVQAAQSASAPTDDAVSLLVDTPSSKTRLSLDELYAGSGGGGGTPPDLSGYVQKNELVVNVKDYGAVADFNGTTGTDNSNAFAAALAATPAGGTLFVPPGRYYHSRTFVFDKSVYFSCGSGGGIGSIIGTELTFAAGVTGISIIQGSKPVAPVKWRMGPFSIKSLSTAAGTDNGIFVNASRGYIDGATINNFGSHGLFVRAGANFGGGNSNNTYISQVRSYGNRGDGIRIEGSDSNACILVKPDVVANYGWGINLQSASMTKVIAAHADQQYNNSPGAYRDAGNSNDWDWLYVEGGSVFLMDAGSSNGKVTSSMYGAPTFESTASAHLNWEVRVYGGDWHQNFVNKAGDQRYRMGVGGVALNSFDLINVTTNQRILSVDGSNQRIQSHTNIRPNVTNTHDLGSDSLRWRNVHVGGMLRIGSIWLRDSNGVLQKSTDGNTWTTV